MAETKYIHDYRVRYDSDAKEGAYHLKDHLETAESKVFFEMAKKNKLCQFEDNADRNYTLEYEGNNLFVLTRRNK